MLEILRQHAIERRLTTIFFIITVLVFALIQLSFKPETVEPNTPEAMEQQ